MTWADLAYRMWSLICETTSGSIGGDEAEWAERKARLREDLLVLLGEDESPKGTNDRGVPGVSGACGAGECLHVRAEDCYSPVRVPENTGKHPARSDEIRARLAIIQTGELLTRRTECRRAGRHDDGSHIDTCPDGTE